jgi:putative addiction module killer protein
MVSDRFFRASAPTYNSLVKYTTMWYSILYLGKKGYIVVKSELYWELKYWCNDEDESPVEEWFGLLNREQFKSVAKELKLLELCGNSLKLPHSRSLKKGLFELRERKYGFRIYYIFLRNRIILMVHAGDKHTQNKDIDIARERLKQLTREEEDYIL